MKRTLTLFLAGVATSASLLAQTSVWKVARDGHTLYLGGTCHTLRPSDLPLPGEYDTAFEAADTLYFETDLERMQSPETQGKLMAAAVLADGSKVSDLLSAEARKSLADYCKRAGIPMEQIQALKPSMVAIMIFALEAQRLGFTPEGVDVQLDRKARAAGKPVHGLETVDEQIAYITTLGAGRESDMVLSTLRDLARMPALLDEMVAAWRRGDLQKIDTLMSAEMRREFPEVFEELLVNRNRAWLPKIEAMLADAPREFVLVGVAHLAGEDGLLAALRQSGCTIEQLQPVK